MDQNVHILSDYAPFYYVGLGIIMCISPGTAAFDVVTNISYIYHKNSDHGDHSTMIYIENWFSHMTHVRVHVRTHEGTQYIWVQVLLWSRVQLKIWGCLPTI